MSVAIASPVDGKAYLKGAWLSHLYLYPLGRGPAYSGPIRWGLL